MTCIALCLSLLTAAMLAARQRASGILCRAAARRRRAGPATASFPVRRPSR
ncbi:hypothetical protein [Fulvimonas soli]|jgi:hypothetical protein|uniref:hypothetical protein n=1 Tax=Fulvimonas soli TaxID=155197 RepID=UPI0014744476|nr:hypothetical protein [Fulvimonas soli]